jgi:hypothetical protein
MIWNELSLESLEKVSAAGIGPVVTGLSGLKHSPSFSPKAPPQGTVDGGGSTGGDYSGDSAGGNNHGGYLGDDNHPRLC